MLAPAITILVYISRHGIGRVTGVFIPREVIKSFQHCKSRAAYVPASVVNNRSQILHAPCAVFDIAPRECDHEVCCGAHVQMRLDEVTDGVSWSICTSLSLVTNFNPS